MGRMRARFARQSRPEPDKRVIEITVADLERFGWHMYDGTAHEWPHAWLDFVGPVHDRYRDDKDALLAVLADIAERHVGGWVAYGAERLMSDIGDVNADHPAYGRIMDASLEFLRRSGVSPARLTGREWKYWLKAGGTIDTWLKRQPEPTEGRIQELPVGTVRRLAQLRDADDSNVVLVERTAENCYSYIVDAPQSDEDPTRSQRIIATAASLHDLYIQIGLGLQIVPYWCDPDLKPYCPLPRPPF
jgi:hypothetical protein